MAFHPYVRKALAAVAAPIAERTPIERQLKMYREKIDEVERYLETPFYAAEYEKEKRHHDALDIIAYIYTRLSHLAYPAEDRDPDLGLYDQDFMPIEIKDNPTASETATCNQLMERILDLRIDFGSSTRFNSFQILIRRCLKVQKLLASTAQTRDEDIDALKERRSFLADAISIRWDLSQIEEVRQDATSCSADYVSGYGNFFTLDAAPKCLEIIKKTNEAALTAINALVECIKRQIAILSENRANSLKTAKTIEIMNKNLQNAEKIYHSLENNRACLSHVERLPFSSLCRYIYD